MKYEMKRFIYICDGVVRDQLRCKVTQVIDAANEHDADKIARERGWLIDHDGCMCGAKHKVFDPVGN